MASSSIADQIIAAVVAVLGGTQLWTFIENRKKFKESEELKKLKERVAELEKTANPDYITYKTLEGIESMAELSKLLCDTFNYGVERIILWCGHNGGGIPKPGSPFYVTAMQWHTKQRNHFNISNYRHLSVDPVYIINLQEMINNKYISLKTDEMPSCQLKTYYEAEGVKKSLLIYCGIKSGRLFYISAASYNSEPYTQNNITNCVLAANAIWNEVSKW